MTAAVRGMTTERNTAMSRRNDSKITKPMTSGSRWARYAEASIPAAVSPPTKTCTPLPAVAWGMTVARRRWTRDAVAAACGAVAG